jgi:hypothetical protein
MVISEVTKYVAFSLVPIEMVFMHTLKVIAKSEWLDFSLMNSNIYLEWCWKYSSTMGRGTLRYTPSTSYDTFPFLVPHTMGAKDILSRLGSDFYKLRHALMVETRLGITKLYNQVHNQSLTVVSVEDELLNDQQFEKKFGKESTWLRRHLQLQGSIPFNSVVTRIRVLRELQTKIDIEILTTFGWNDISLNHNFYELEYLPENDRIRFAIHKNSRKEILKRLVSLNHDRYKAEPQALTKMKKKSPKMTDSNLFQDLKDL